MTRNKSKQYKYVFCDGHCVGYYKRSRRKRIFKAIASVAIFIGILVVIGYLISNAFVPASRVGRGSDGITQIR